MEVEFLSPAETELVEAIAYYNNESEGLGYEFAAEAKRTIQRIVDFPHAWTSLSKRTHRCRTNRFPFGVIYQIRQEVILVVAIMHLHRKPGKNDCLRRGSDYLSFRPLHHQAAQPANCS